MTPARTLAARALLLTALLTDTTSAFFPSVIRSTSVVRVIKEQSRGQSSTAREADKNEFLNTVRGGSAPAQGDFFESFGKQFTSFFEQLFNPGAPPKPATPAPQAPKKRRSGGPVALVFGATGRTGREVVDSLLAQGFDVVAAVRNASKAADVFGAKMTASATPGMGLLDVKEKVDVTDPSTLSPAVFEGVQHVVMALGPIGGPQPGGGFGFLPGLTSEDVDYKGVANIVSAFEKARGASTGEAAKKALGKEKEKVLFRFQSAGDLEQWERLDDVIMGGRSSSAFQLADGFAEYKGELVVEDGGFCGTRASEVNADLKGYDALRLRLMGDGNRYKLNLKTLDTMANESVYQVAFDTVAGAWCDVELPFDLFLPVVRNRVNYKAPRLSSSRPPIVASLGLVYSRFEFNRQPNPLYKPGPFSLKIKSIAAYAKPRPAVVLVSSAGAERNAKVETEEERKAEIPIVQLNPGGILNWKYKGEAALRASGLPYTIFRACGLVPDRAFNKTAMLQAAQGDVMTGRLTRGDLASAISASLTSPYAAYKTLEIRRDENDDASNRPTNFDALYKGLVADTARVTAGILPFPEPVEPPADVFPDRRAEILNDPRVQATIQRDRAISSAPDKKASDAADDQPANKPTPATA